MEGMWAQETTAAGVLSSLSYGSRMVARTVMPRRCRDFLAGSILALLGANIFDTAITYANYLADPSHWQEGTAAVAWSFGSYGPFGLVLIFLQQFIPGVLLVAAVYAVVGRLRGSRLSVLTLATLFPVYYGVFGHLLGGLTWILPYSPSQYVLSADMWLYQQSGLIANGVLISGVLAAATVMVAMNVYGSQLLEAKPRVPKVRAKPGST